MLTVYTFSRNVLGANSQHVELLWIQNMFQYVHAGSVTNGNFNSEKKCYSSVGLIADHIVQIKGNI